MIKCIFKHDWIYKEKRLAKFSDTLGTDVYDKRFCSKCGKMQENIGYFDTSFGAVNMWKNSWMTIGYQEPKKENKKK